MVGHRELGRSRVRLLICDDQALFRAGMRLLLGAQPEIEVVGEAADGHAVVDEVQRLRPDVVLMDIAMPGLDGIEATRRITRTHREVRVLILSMYVEDQLVARCLEAGASGYVLKDALLPQLAHAVDVVAGGGRYLSPAVLERVIDPWGEGGARIRTRYDLLTDRERQVLKLLAEGLSMKELAARIDRSVRTVEVHKYNLMRKLDVHHGTGLIKYAIAHRLVELPVLEHLDGDSPPAKGRVED